MHLIFDTETTGKADFKAAPEAPQQPRMVQLAALLLNNDFEPEAEFCLIIKPDGYVISDEVAKIHGITQARAEKYGVSEKATLLLFKALCSRATSLVAHNIVFDALIIDKACAVHDVTFDPPATKFCTMNAMTNICKLPGRFDNYKWPTLTEAYQHVTGQPPLAAHNALADVYSCATIYKYLQGRHADHLASIETPSP